MRLQQGEAALDNACLRLCVGGAWLGSSLPGAVLLLLPLLLLLPSLWLWLWL